MNALVDESAILGREEIIVLTEGTLDFGSKVKLRLSLCGPWRCMKEWRNSHSVLTSVLDWGGQRYLWMTRTPSVEWTWRRMSSRAGRGGLKINKIFQLCQESNHDSWFIGAKTSDQKPTTLVEASSTGLYLNSFPTLKQAHFSVSKDKKLNVVCRYNRCLLRYS